MTKIKNYALDTDVTGNDKWIGSDSGSLGRTKNFTPKNLAKYFNNKQVIDTSNLLRFVYDTIDLGDNRIPGSFSFESEVGDTIPFSFISSLVFSKVAKSGYNVSSFMESMIGYKILIQKTNAPDTFAYYELNSFEQRDTEPNFYDASLSFLSGNGVIESDEEYFISLVSNTSGDKTFVYNQVSASDTWTIQHNLDKFASVSVVDSAGNLVVGNVNYIDSNEITVTFNAAFSGKAYIN